MVNNPSRKLLDSFDVSQKGFAMGQIFDPAFFVVPSDR